MIARALKHASWLSPRRTPGSLSGTGLSGTGAGVRASSRRVTPAKAGVQKASIGLDSGFRRNDDFGQMRKNSKLSYAATGYQGSRTCG